MLKVFSKNLSFEYKTRFLSEATIFYLIFSVGFRFLLPLVIVWCTDSFWIKEAQFREMPTVDFKRKIVLVVEGEREERFNLTNTNYFRKSFTTFPEINSALERSQEYLETSLEDFETDYDHDGRVDVQNLGISLTGLPGSVRSVDLILFFGYRISSYVDLRMESIVRIQKTHWTSGRELTIDGTIELVQRRPFFSAGYDFRYNHSLISDSGKFLLTSGDDEKYQSEELFDLSTLVQRVRDRDYFTQLSEPVSTEWKTQQSKSENFRLNLKIRVQPQSFVYETSIGFLLKWALVQYIAVWLLINWAIEKLECCIYRRWYIFPTIRMANDNLKTMLEKNI